METRRDLLEQAQDELEDVSEEAEEFLGIDRREFVFLSLVAAAAGTFSVPAGARAQGRGAVGAAPQAPLPILPLGEPISWTFQVYPGGTGVLMEKLINERGAK